MKELIVVFGIVFGLLFAFCWANSSYYSEHHLKVTSVGGCDKYGDCGAVLEGNIAARCEYPAVGATAYCHVLHQGD